MSKKEVEAQTATEEKKTPKQKTKILRNTKNYRVEMTIGETCLAFNPKEDKIVPVDTPVLEGIGIIVV